MLFSCLKKKIFSRLEKILYLSVIEKTSGGTRWRNGTATAGLLTRHPVSAYLQPIVCRSLAVSGSPGSTVLTAIPVSLTLSTFFPVVRLTKWGGLTCAGISSFRCYLVASLKGNPDLHLSLPLRANHDPGFMVTLFALQEELARGSWERCKVETQRTK